MDRCPPPANFRPAKEVSAASFANSPPSFVGAMKKPRGKKAVGLRYERKAHSYLSQQFGEFLIVSPWLRFRSKNNGAFALGQYKYCQPDAIAINPDSQTITVFEIKLKHTAEAWWQLRQLYIPVLRNVLGPSWSFIPVEVVKWFDPDTKFPERFSVLYDLTSLRATLPSPSNSVPGQRSSNERIEDGEPFFVHIWGGTS